MPSKKKIVIFLVAAGLARLLAASPIMAQYDGARPVHANWKEGFASIDIDQAKDLLNFLAGPDFRGRSPRTLDYAAAAGFAASYFRNLELKPAGDNGSFFQRFRMEEITVAAESAKFESADSALRLEYGTDYNFTTRAEVNASVKFAFLRITKEFDPSQIDVSLFQNKAIITTLDSARANIGFIQRLTSQRAASRALMTILPAPNGTITARTSTEKIKGVAPMVQPPLPSIRLSENAAKKIAEKCGAQNYLAASAVKATIEPCEIEFKLSAKVTARDSIETMNIIARIEGTDPELKSETIIIGAHLDHLGQTAQGLKYGADDNASGVTAAMLIARAIMKNPVKPKRSVLIALWSLEEAGLHGSWNYANRPIAPIDKTIAYLNMDMVGRNENDRRFNETAEQNHDSIYISAVKFNSPDLFRLLVESNEFVRLRLKEDVEDRVMRSDTASFYINNIPTLKAFTGEHPDYHQAGDTPDKINFEKLVNVAKWLYITTMELSSRPNRPRFEKSPFTPVSPQQRSTSQQNHDRRQSSTVVTNDN